MQAQSTCVPVALQAGLLRQAPALHAGLVALPVGVAAAVGADRLHVNQLELGAHLQRLLDLHRVVLRCMAEQRGVTEQRRAVRGGKAGRQLRVSAPGAAPKVAARTRMCRVTPRSRAT